MKMTHQQIKELAENALHEGCRHIQDALGVKTGDTAGLFFCGEVEDTIHTLFRHYIETELMIKTYDDEVTL
jgi:hypothetical protein